MGLWDRVVADYWNAQPHPQAPELTIGEYATAVKLATKARFGGHATPQEATAFWQEFKGMNARLGDRPISPDEFGHLLDQIAPVSFSLHGRPPSMYELTRLRDAHPKDVHAYFSELPDKHYPTVPAGEMARHMAMAEPHANLHLGRPPVKAEAAYLHAARASASDVEGYYRSLKEDRESKSGIQAGV